MRYGGSIVMSTLHLPGRLAVSLLVGLAAVILLPAASHAAASAKITAVTLQVYHQLGANGAVRWSKTGDLLPAGSRVHTLKRSACEIRFPDGSRVRMGPRSDLIIHDVTTKHLQVLTGEVFANIVSGTGAQIQGATATASIKGTWVLMQAPTAPGVFPVRTTDTMWVWNGSADLVTPSGTIPVGDGQTGTVGGDGAPVGGTGGMDASFGGGELNPGWANTSPGVDTGATPGTPAGDVVKDVATTTREEVVPIVAPPTTGTVNVVITGVRPAGVGLAGLGAGGSLAPLLGTLSLAAAGQVSPEESRRQLLGKRFWGPSSQIELVGVKFNGGSLGGLRLRSSVLSGHLYGEAGLQAFSDLKGDWDTAISDLFVVDRLGNSDLTFGRQRYAEGPINNSGLGTLFGAIHFDGISYKTHTSSYTAKFSWLQNYQAFGRSPLETNGWLGRVSTPLLGGQIAVNALQQAGDGWGISGDISMPIIPRELDMYAEVGCDPMGRHIETFGAYLPGLYQRTNVDLYVERSSRGDNAPVWSAIAYADMGERWTGLFGTRVVQGQNPEFFFGFVKQFGSLSF
jgi:hypothetical protein